MNDLGWTLGWLTVQVAILLLPAIGLHALASRRGPASAAWVATVSLAMVVILGVLALVPLPSGRGGGAGTQAQVSPILAPNPSANPDLTAAIPVDRVPGAEARSRAFTGLRLAWSGIERRAAGPVARFRPWGRIWAVALLAGSAFGLIRLSVGLWAVRLCRRRGRTVDDPDLIGLVEGLGRAMGCDRPVQIREVFDLTTPATAGWTRPLLLLPGNWRTWTEAERRAVVAHELAHVIRGDYAAGLVARLAEVMNPFHPLVRWMAGRLHLEQELAADAMGAKFAGGRSSYLRALARLALEQQERPRTWPARAFLPARGTLIRRIAMLNDKEFKDADGRAWSAAGRRAAVFGLLTLTVLVAGWKAPAAAGAYQLGTIRADGEARTSQPSETVRAVAPFEMRFIPDTMNGVVGFRPAAMARRSGMGMLTSLLRKAMAEDFAHLVKQLKVDTTRPGFVKLRCEDIESVTCGLKIDKYEPHPNEPKPKGEQPTGRLEFSGFTVRAVAPFDWLGFCRQWSLELEEVREGRGGYYKINGSTLGNSPFGTYCVYLPDDRTIVINEWKWIKELIGRQSPTGPSYIQGKDWERVSGDLLAVALNNQDDAFTKDWDPDRKKVPSFIKGVDRLVLGLADLDLLSPRGEVTARDPSTAEALGRSIPLFATLGLAQLANAPGEAKEFEPLVKLARGFLSNVQVIPEGRTVKATSEGFGSFADLGTFFQEMVEKAGLRVSKEKPKAKEAKAGSDTEKR